MSRKRFNEAEIHEILQEYRDGINIPEIIDKYGISQATFYNWRSKYGNLSTSEMIEFNKLKEDNERLKRMFADLSLENQKLKAKLKKRDSY